jgi:hypothetical protein
MDTIGYLQQKTYVQFYLINDNCKPISKIFAWPFAIIPSKGDKIKILNFDMYLFDISEYIQSCMLTSSGIEYISFAAKEDKWVIEIYLNYQL